MVIEKHICRPVGCVTALVANGIIAVLVLMSPPGMAQGTSTAVPSASQYVKGSLCTQPDQVVFSCPLARNGKIVSMCAAGNASPHTFYYVFGRPHAVEMRYPNDPAASNDGFLHSILGYPGGTGGYAYSFVNNGIKYIVYSVSGKFGYESDGVIVQKSGSLFALADMECSKGKMIETSSDSLTDETLKWRVDNELNGRALPDTKK